MNQSAAALLCELTPWLSNSSRQLMEQLGQRAETLCTVDDIVDDLGLRDRHKLARQLQREGLPQFDELRGWIQVVSWLQRFEISKQTLSAIAKNAGRQPSALYRRVKQVTGMTWKQVIIQGTARVVRAFLRRCRLPAKYVMHEARTTSAFDASEAVDSAVADALVTVSSLTDERRRHPPRLDRSCVAVAQAVGGAIRTVNRRSAPTETTTDQHGGARTRRVQPQSWLHGTCFASSASTCPGSALVLAPGTKHLRSGNGGL